MALGVGERVADAASGWALELLQPAEQRLEHQTRPQWHARRQLTPPNHQHGAALSHRAAGRTWVHHVAGGACS